jgi:hypothetical protein
MALVVIRLLLLGCAASGIFGLEKDTNNAFKRLPISENRPRRHLLSTLGSIGGNNGGGKLNNKDTATYRIHRDWLPQEDIPHPELYYQDLDTGERQLIWAFDDTLPRDVLAGRPDVWMHATFRIEKDADLLLPFLEHYSRLGIAFDRMIFTLLASSLRINGLVHVQNALQQVGAVYHILLFKEEISKFCTSRAYKKAVFEANLRATYNVPAKDWIIAVEGDELLQFHLLSSSSSNAGGALSRINRDKILEQQQQQENRNVSAEEFFETLELKEINWVAGLPRERLSSSSAFGTFEKKINPLINLRGLFLEYPFKCQDTISSVSVKNNQKVVAYRGYLRPDMFRHNIVSPDKAKIYFDSLDDGDDVFHNKEKAKKFVSLYDVTPYSTYWEFYKTPLMVGNVYLWSERKADDTSGVVAMLNHFHWHAHGRINQSSRASEAAACEDTTEEYDAMLYNRLSKGGKVDLDGKDGITCEEEEEQSLLQLPLRKEAALSLAALRSLMMPIKGEMSEDNC